MGKGKRNRDQHAKERVMQERDDEMFDRIEAWSDDPDTMEDVTYYRCSMNTEHGDYCKEADPVTNPDTGEVFENGRIFGEEGEGYAPCEEMTKWDVLLHHENFKWDKLGFETANVKSNTFRMGVQVEAMLEIMEKELGVSNDKMNEYFQPLMFARMKGVREIISQNIVEQRRRAIVAGGMPPGIPDLGNNGGRIT